jgi:type I restriction enzyme, S subunit
MSDAALDAADRPASWALTTLGTVVDYGKTDKAEPSELRGDDWILELEDIEKDSSRLLQRVTFSARQSKSTKSRFAVGDVLYGKLRPYLNKVLIADRPGYCTTEIVPIKAGSHLDARYLFHWLKHPAFLTYVEAESHGMNMPRLGTETGRAAPFVLAPRAEQSRIADELDTLLARVNACNDRFDAIPALLKRFRQAALAAATDGELTSDWGEKNKASWQRVRLHEVASDFSYGSAKKSSKTGGTPVLRMGNIQGGRLDWGDLVFTSDKNEVAKYSLTDGDVLFNRTNSPELVGKTAVFRGERKAVYAGYLIRVRCSPQLLPDFLNYCLGSPAGRDYCWRVKSDGVSQSNINAKKLAAFSFDLPSIEEQTEIVRRVEALFALADRIEARCTAARTHAQRLAPQLLAKAFRGELVPQNPTDEPASALLARIAAERSVTSIKSPTAPSATPADRAAAPSPAARRAQQDSLPETDAAAPRTRSRRLPSSAPWR